VELSHSFDLCELDCVSVLESVPDLVERGHDSSVGLLSDASHHGGDRLLSVDVVDDELVAEVGEDLGAKAGSVGDDEGDIVLPGEKKNWTKNIKHVESQNEWNKIWSWQH